MTTHKLFRQVFGMILLCVGLPMPGYGQIIPQAQFGYEFVSWGDTPSSIQTLFGLTWIKTHSKRDNDNLGSGRADVSSLASRLTEGGNDVYVRFEFENEDSGLVALTMIAGGLPGLYDVSEEFVDMIWDANLDRFGEPSGGKWIPLIGESKEWTIGNVFVKMVRMNLPSEGILVKYVLKAKT